MPSVKMPPRRCEHCGLAFEPVQHNQLYCSKACCSRANELRRQKMIAAKYPVHASCGRTRTIMRGRNPGGFNPNRNALNPIET